MSSDTLILAHVDKTRKKVVLISIPRDMLVEIEGNQGKICAATTMGGTKLTVRTVRNFTKLSIPYYMAVDFKGFKRMVDALGGIEIFVDKPIIDKTPMFQMYIHRGHQKFDGDMALNYVRYRHSDPEGDIGRIKRQQRFMRAVVDQILKTSFVIKIPFLVNTLKDSTDTNLSISEMLQLAFLFKSVKKEDIEIITLPGNPRDIAGVKYLIPDKKRMEVILDKLER